MFDPETPPELAVTRWLNTTEPLSLAALKGRVVALVAFQMLCRGCLEHALPQARRLAARFNPEQVAVIGLHSVFENHAAMLPAALEVLVKELGLPFPIAIDKPSADDGMPETMTAYDMRGTPSLLIFDREGRLRRHYFGQPDDITLAAELMALATEDKGAPRNEAARIERIIASTLRGDAHQHDHGHHDHGHAGHDHDGHAHGADCGCDHHHHGHDHHHGHAPADNHHHANDAAAGNAKTEPR